MQLATHSLLAQPFCLPDSSVFTFWLASHTNYRQTSDMRGVEKKNCNLQHCTAMWQKVELGSNLHNTCCNKNVA